MYSYCSQYHQSYTIKKKITDKRQMKQILHNTYTVNLSENSTDFHSQYVKLQQYSFSTVIHFLQQ